MVVQGFWQRDGINYDEKDLYAPTLSATVFRLLFAVVAQCKYRWRVIDVKTAFLNAALKHTVYVTLPKGGKDALDADGNPRVFKLLKALYGLKQAPKEWNDEFDGTLRTECGLTRLKMDPCVYIKTTARGNTIYVGIFVDDTIILHHDDDADVVESLVTTIKSKYDVSDGGESSTILGMRIMRHDDGSLTIDQQSYIERIIDRARGDMSSVVPVSTPEASTTQLVSLGAVNKSHHSNEIVDTELLDPIQKEKYHSYVGALLYAAVWTRPDITHAVGQLTRFVSAPRLAHWRALERVLRYLISLSHVALTYLTRRVEGVHSASSPDSSIILGPVYADSNWGGDVETRKSVTGIVIKLNGNTIWWCSKQQPSVAKSSTEAEYVALSEATSEVMWLRQLLHELKLPQDAPTVIYGDNDSSITIGNNSATLSRLKHIDIRHHFIREQVNEFRTIVLKWIPTERQQADVLTKALSKVQFIQFQRAIMSPVNSQ